MTPSVYIFIGHSGAGKGTQIAKLQEKIRTVDSSTPFYHLKTGDAFRELIRATSYTGKRTKALTDQGVLPPAFLGVHAWAHQLITEYTGTEHVFIDGTPRVEAEIPALLSAFEFYDWHPHVIYLSVSDEWAHDRLVGRGRADDRVPAEVWGRLQWFHEKVVPAIELLKDVDRVTFHTIMGEQTIDEVHRDICEALGFTA